MKRSILIIIMLLCMLALAACADVSTDDADDSAQNVTSSAANDSDDRDTKVSDGAVTSSNDAADDTDDCVVDSGVGYGDTPPSLLIICDDQKIETMRGTSTWTCPSDEDGTMMTICADCPHPLQAREYMPHLDATEGAVCLIFDVYPDELHVCCWSDDCWGNTDAASESVTMAGGCARTVPDGCCIMLDSVQLKQGTYIYEVTAAWSSNEQYYGTACYSFCATYEE